MSPFIWVGFVLLVVGLLVLDLKVLHRNVHAVKVREAGLFSLLWIAISLGFNVLIYFAYENHWFELGTNPEYPMTGRDAAGKFLAAYLIEKALSVDNLFVIATIFGFFRIESKFQHEVLFWGIFGAIVFRGAMIATGSVLLHTFSWITYVFGGILILSAVRMLLSKPENIDPDKSWIVRVARRVYPMSDAAADGSFFTYENGRRTMTRLFLALLVIESTDVLFAVDSIPAVFSITSDPFIAFTSNIFAILGLRSLYFLLAAVIDKFHYLKIALVVILAFVGVKMLLVHYLEIPTWLSLSVIVGILTIGIVASMAIPAKKSAFPPSNN